MSFGELPALISVFLLSCVGVYLIRHYALKNLLDIPNQRSSHSLPTPRGGGLAIVLAFYPAVLLAYINQLIQSNLALALLAGVPVAIIGFIDDHRPVSIRSRIAVHLACSVAASLLLAGMPALPLMQLTVEWGIFGYFIVILALVWGLNLFNFMDGIDGIAGSEAVFIALGLAFVSGFGADGQFFLQIALALSVLGFLIWNWPPAKIFMGDVGSGFLGFISGVLILSASHSNPVMLYAGLVLAGLFIVDASVTLARRYWTGQKWYQAHCSHAYQHAARRYGHLKVVLVVWLINSFWLLPWAWFCLQQPNYAFMSLILAYTPLILLVLRLDAGKP